MKNFPAFFILSVLLFTSCSQKKTFPEKVTQGLEKRTKVGEQSTLNIDEKELLTFVNQFENQDEHFDLEDFEKYWKLVSSKYPIDFTNENDFRIWVEITGLLLELTQKEIYAAELEAISCKSAERANMVSPFVLTRNIDHIYVNLFRPIEIQYSHSLGGVVTFKQESEYPKSGNVKLHIGMTERRYLEVYIRIPVWAEGTTVTVKQVKYLAKPGTYCKIAKKWKEGDLVEVEFPMEKKP